MHSLVSISYKSETAIRVATRRVLRSGFIAIEFKSESSNSLELSSKTDSGATSFRMSGDLAVCKTGKMNDRMKRTISKVIEKRGSNTYHNEENLYDNQTN